MKPRLIIGERALRQFLAGQFNASSEHVDAALKELREKGGAGIHVSLSDEKLRDLGLK